MGKWRKPDFDQYEDVKGQNSSQSNKDTYKTNKGKNQIKKTFEEEYSLEELIGEVEIQKNESWSRKQRASRKEKEKRHKRYDDWYDEEWN